MTPRRAATEAPSRVGVWRGMFAAAPGLLVIVVALTALIGAACGGGGGDPAAGTAAPAGETAAESTPGPAPAAAAGLAGGPLLAVALRLEADPADDLAPDLITYLDDPATQPLFLPDGPYHVLILDADDHTRLLRDLSATADEAVDFSAAAPVPGLEEATATLAAFAAGVELASVAALDLLTNGFQAIPFTSDEADASLLAVLADVYTSLADQEADVLEAVDAIAVETDSVALDLSPTGRARALAGANLAGSLDLLRRAVQAVGEAAADGLTAVGQGLQSLAADVRAGLGVDTPTPVPVSPAVQQSLHDVALTLPDTARVNGRATIAGERPTFAPLDSRLDNLYGGLQAAARFVAAGQAMANYAVSALRDAAGAIRDALIDDNTTYADAEASTRAMSTHFRSGILVGPFARIDVQIYGSSGFRGEEVPISVAVTTREPGAVLRVDLGDAGTRTETLNTPGAREFTYRVTYDDTGEFPISATLTLPDGLTLSDASTVIVTTPMLVLQRFHVGVRRPADDGVSVIVEFSVCVSGGEPGYALTVLAPPDIHLDGDAATFGVQDFQARVDGGSPSGRCYEATATGTVVYVPGFYPVQLEVQDATGIAVQETTELIVYGPLTVSIAGPTDEIDIGENVTYVAEASGGPHGPDTNYTFVWAVDGAPPDYDDFSDTLTQSFETGGEHRVAVLVRDADAPAGSAIATLHVYVGAPAVTARGTLSGGTADEPSTGTIEITFPPAGGPVTGALHFDRTFDEGSRFTLGGGSSPTCYATYRYELVMEGTYDPDAPTGTAAFQTVLTGTYTTIDFTEQVCIDVWGSLDRVPGGGLHLGDVSSVDWEADWDATLINDRILSGQIIGADFNAIVFTP